MRPALDEVKAQLEQAEASGERLWMTARHPWSLYDLEPNEELLAKPMSLQTQGELDRWEAGSGCLFRHLRKEGAVISITPALAAPTPRLGVGC